MQVPAVPDWFKVGRIALYVLAVVAMLVHLALFDDKSRERHHQALTRFSESIRSKSVNLFEMLIGAARLAREGLIKIYGRSFGRRLVISTGLALGYIALAAALTFIDSRPVLPKARAEKARLEKAINPNLKYSDAERNYAFDGRTVAVRDAVRFEYSHNDPRSIQIRESVHNFDQSWEEALSRHPLCEVLAWLTMLEGHPHEPGLHLAPAVSVVLSTVFLDLLSLLCVLAFLNRMVKCSSSLRFAAWTLAMVLTAGAFVLIALICSSYFLRGSQWAYILILLGAPLALIFFIGALASAVTFALKLFLKRHAITHEDLASAIIAPLAGGGALVFLVYIVQRLRSVGAAEAYLPPIHHAPPWILAFACIGPALLSMAILVVAWLLRMTGGILLTPLFTYVLISLRANRNIGIGLFAFPMVFLTALSLVWEYLARRN